MDLVQQRFLEPCGLSYTKVQWDQESAEYGACKLLVGSKRIMFRVSKITPTKIGQFVTFWKRLGRGPIMPYDMQDDFDFLMIYSATDVQSGLFIFSKELLGKQGVVSKNGIGGKRAIRVYPSWDIVDNAQATKSQKWQTVHFFDKHNCDRITRLFA